MRAESGATGAGLSRGLARSFALHCALRALEALALGWLACACVLAAILVTTPAAAPLQAWLAGAIAFACCSASWWVEHAPNRADHVRAVDRRLGFEGALVTAGALEAHTGGVAALLVARVAARVRGSELARAALPRTPLVVVAALLGAAVLFAAEDASSRTHSSGLDPDATVGQTLDAAAGALRNPSAPRGSENAVSSGTRTNDLELARALEAAARDPKTLVNEAHALEARLRDAARSSRTERNETLALLRAADALGLVRTATNTSASSTAKSAPTTDELHGRERGAAASTASPTKADPGSAGSGATGSGSSADRAFASGALASPGTDGRMVAPQSALGASSPLATPVATNRGPEGGVADARWWPAHYDSIVQSWLAPPRSPKHP